MGAPELFFHETMTGPLTWGVKEPEEGARLGGATPLSLRACIRIDSLEDFLRDPQHEAELSGRITFPPLPGNLPLLQGRFQLFSPTEDERLRLMRYRAVFQHRGRAYTLSGTKLLRDDPGPDLWPDTTRLLTTLHEGWDERGPVVGAGVLSLGVCELLSLLASMRAPGGGPLSLVRFGQFFLRNLWELYAP